MKKWKGDLLAIFAASVLVMAVLVFFGAGKTSEEQITLNLALYPLVPDYESFEETVEKCWSEQHPDVRLKEIAATPGAEVFRIKPDGMIDLNESIENADALPDL